MPVLQSQSALLVYTHMCKPYAGAIIKIAMYVKCWNVIKTGPTECIMWLVTYIHVQLRIDAIVYMLEHAAVITAHMYTIGYTNHP